MKILVLDDDKTLLTTLKAVLEANGHEADCVDNAKDAAKMVEGDEYDVALVDYKLPDNDGLWFMRNAKPADKMKVLLITAYVNRNVINRMFDLGASGYIIKPFDEDDLLRHLAFYVK